MLAIGDARSLPCSSFIPRKGFRAAKPSSKSKIAASDVKKTVVLTAKRIGKKKLPVFGDGGTRQACHISEFLSHPLGAEALLNSRAFQRFQFVDVNHYRCTLPAVQLLNLEGSPILDLRIIATKQDCTVELLSCQFEGSEALERQNEHFSVTMANHITWDTECSEPFVKVDVKVNVYLEIYMQPFTLLPESIVQGHGNIMMQALVDRLFPMFLEQLIEDYKQWVRDLGGDRI